MATYYMVVYFSSYISNCDKFPETEKMSYAECCQGTWENFGNSVSIALVIIVIITIVFFGILYWGKN
jgi:hypothetical protein